MGFNFRWVFYVALGTALAGAKAFGDTSYAYRDYSCAAEYSDPSANPDRFCCKTSTADSGFVSGYCASGNFQTTGNKCGNGLVEFQCLSSNPNGTSQSGAGGSGLGGVLSSIANSVKSFFSGTSPAPNAPNNQAAAQAPVAPDLGTGAAAPVNGFANPLGGNSGPAAPQAAAANSGINPNYTLPGAGAPIGGVNAPLNNNTTLPNTAAPAGSVGLTTANPAVNSGLNPNFAIPGGTGAPLGNVNAAPNTAPDAQAANSGTQSGINPNYTLPGASAPIANTPVGGANTNGLNTAAQNTGTASAAAPGGSVGLVTANPAANSGLNPNFAIPGGTGAPLGNVNAAPNAAPDAQSANSGTQSGINPNYTLPGASTPIGGANTNGLMNTNPSNPAAFGGAAYQGQVSAPAAQMSSNDGVKVNTAPNPDSAGEMVTTLNGGSGGNMTIYQAPVGSNGATGNTYIQYTSGNGGNNYLVEKQDPAGGAPSYYTTTNPNDPTTFQPANGNNFPGCANCSGQLNPDNSYTFNDGNNKGFVNLHADGSADTNSDTLLPANANSAPSQNLALNSGAGANGGNANSPKNMNSAANTDPCSVSMSIAPGNSKMSCAGTQTLLSTSQITQVAGNAVGSMTVNAMGQQQQQQLYQNSIATGAAPSQSSYYSAAASLQGKAATIQTSMGVTQLALGYMENKAGNVHKQNAQTFMNGAGNASVYQITPGAANTVQVKTSDTYAGNSLANNGGTQAPMLAAQAQIAVKASVKTGETAANEQASVASKASSQGFLDMVRGGVQTMQGLFALSAAHQEQQLANTLAAAPTGIQPPGADPFNPGSGGTNVVTGSGINPNVTASGTPGGAALMPGADGSLGAVLGGPAGGGLAGAGPAPGAFAPAADGQGGGGGGDLGAGGSVSTSPAAAGSNAEPTAKYAENGMGGVAYQGSGASLPGGKAGGGGDPSIGLKEAFAQLAGGQDKGAEPGQDILNYRKIASDAPFAPLPQGEDFFKYIHTAYEGLQKKGRVGL